MMLDGAIFHFGDHIDTDVIIPARYLGTSDAAELAPHCFEPLMPDFPQRVRPGDFIFAGENFGCGSSREHAPIAIKGCGIAGVVATSFSRIFFRSAINIGLPAIVCPEAVVAAAGETRAAIDLAAGTIVLGGRSFTVTPLPPEVLGILNCGGLVPFMKQRLAAQPAGGHA